MGGNPETVRWVATTRRLIKRRAAILRGSRTRIFCTPSHGLSSSANGTRVVLPAPGGATSTARPCAASAASMSGNTASMGRGSSMRKSEGLFESCVRPSCPQPRCLERAWPWKPATLSGIRWTLNRVCQAYRRHLQESLA